MQYLSLWRNKVMLSCNSMSTRAHHAIQKAPSWWWCKFFLCAFFYSVSPREPLEFIYHTIVKMVVQSATQKRIKRRLIFIMEPLCVWDRSEKTKIPKGGKCSWYNNENVLRLVLYNRFIRDEPRRSLYRVSSNIQEDRQILWVMLYRIQWRVDFFNGTCLQERFIKFYIKILDAGKAPPCLARYTVLFFIHEFWQ